jgi:hypothetical protein
LETPQEHIRIHAAFDQCEGNRFVCSGTARQVDHSHAALADTLDDLIVAESSSYVGIFGYWRLFRLHSRVPLENNCCADYSYRISARDEESGRKRDSPEPTPTGRRYSHIDTRQAKATNEGRVT